MAYLFDNGIFSVIGIGSEILVGAKLYWYVAGTSTPQDTYNDDDLVTPNTNPVIADSAGRFPQMWLGGTPYKFILKDAADVTLRTQDNISGPLSLEDLSAGDGASSIGYDVTATFSDGSVGSALQNMPTPLSQFGDTSTPSGTANAISASIVQRSGTPLLIDTEYVVPTTAGPYDLGGSPIYARPAAVLEGAAYLGSERRYENRIPVNYNDGTAYYSYTLGRKFGRPFDERERPLDVVTDAALKIEAMDMTTLETSRWPSDTTDVWTTETPTTAADSVSYSITADNNWHVTWVPVQGGMDATAYISGAISGSIFGVFIRTTKGFEYFYATAGLSGNFAVKLEGAAPSVNSGFSWLGQGTLDSYAFHKSLLTVRALQGRKYAIMLNGTEIFPVRDLIAPGEIVDVGFGIFGNNTSTIIVNNAVRRVTREPTGAVPLHIGITGNSISDTLVHGTWDKWMQDSLDGAMGLKILSVTNLAVSGANSLGIAGQIAAGALGPSNVCLIVAPEVNDVQSGASVATTVGNIGTMIDTLLTSELKVILVTGYLWYSQALAGGQGQNTTFYAEGALHRSAMRRLAATKGVDFFDLAETSGPMLPAYLATPTVTDPNLRDNIHPTARYYQQIGYWMAKAVLRCFRPKMTPSVISASFPSGAYDWLDNSWTTSEASYSMAEDGMLWIDAVLDAGTAADGTTVINLPAAYRPVANRYLTCSTDAAATGLAPILQCQADGQCKIYGLDPTATFIRINGGFFTALAAK